MGYMTQQERRNNFLIGNTETRKGSAWWANSEADHYDDQGRPNHFETSVPIARARELLDIKLSKEPLAALIACDLDDPRMAGIRSDGIPYRIAEHTGKVTVVRQDTGDIVGAEFGDSSYHVHQYPTHLLDHTGHLLQESQGDLVLASAGLLENGGQGFVQFASPKVRQVVGIEHVPFLTASTGCTGVSTRYKRGTIAIVCENTHAAAMGAGGAEVKISHKKSTENALAALVSASQVIGIIQEAADDFEQKVSMLYSAKITKSQQGKWIEAMAPVTDKQGLPLKAGRGLTMAITKREQLSELLSSDERVAPWAGTALGILQAANTWDQHIKGVRGRTREEANMLRSLNGDLAKADHDALKVLELVLAGK